MRDGLKTMPHELAFTELIQLHERMWGNEHYPERPTLAQLLEGPIVVMWVDMNPPRRKLPSEHSAESYFTFAVYRDATALSEALMSALLLGKPASRTNRRISRVFLHQKPVKITGVRLLTT
jgi:hypothetical protein